jgi:uncharacterized spore protein YtfJ
MMDTANTADELVRQITGIPDQLGAGACFGTPVERDGHTIIPVARVNFGLGLGFGRGGGSSVNKADGQPGDSGEGEGGGGGGGGGSTPVAVIDISPAGIEITPILDSTRIALGRFAMVGWMAFWCMMTVRTIARERAKTRRIEIERA